jgi:hypothetical protein
MAALLFLPDVILFPEAPYEKSAKLQCGGILRHFMDYHCVTLVAPVSLLLYTAGV